MEILIIILTGLIGLIGIIFKTNKDDRGIRNKLSVFGYVLIIMIISGTIFTIVNKNNEDKKLTEERELANKKSESIESKIDFLTYLLKAKNEYSNYLDRKYSDGYVLFGVYENGFVYNPQGESKTMVVNASWERTQLNLDKKSNSMKLVIYDFSYNYVNTHITIGEMQTLGIPILPKGKESPINLVDGPGQIKIFLEVLENDSENPVYVIGFKK